MTRKPLLLETAERVAAALQDAAREALGDELPDLTLTESPRPELGDFATASCLQAAKAFRKPPRQIAQAIVDAAADVEGVERFEIAGPGYVNVFLDRPAFAEQLLRRLEAEPGPPETVHDAPRVDADRAKVIVEHTNINPNKAAHVGHLRNAVLGDSLVRLLQHAGNPVEVQNYIDDTGVQVADVVVAFTAMEGRSPEQALKRVEELLADPARPFDHVCWDLYAEVGRWLAEDESRQAHRRETLHSMERGEGALAALGERIADAVTHRHLATMRRIGVSYHLLPCESDILAARFWEAAFERLKEAGAIHLVEEGKNAGCWVMPLTETEEFKNLEEPDKVIVRGDGTVTYVGKDIAFQTWKLGLIGSDFRYRRWEDPEETHEIWTTDTAGGTTEGHPAFGHGSAVYNVIDVRQSYLQAIVKNALLLCGHEEQAEASIHYSYEMVALTPRTAEALGFELTDEDRAAAYVEMSGRRGLGVKADDLLDRLTAEAARRVSEANDERGLGLSAADVDATARAIAVGALRYYMVKVTRNRVIAFDIDDALQFTGETGPYLQYSAVRTANIFRKLEAAGAELGDLAAALAEREGGFLSEDRTWSVVLLAARLPDVVGRACSSLEIAPLAKHAFELCQSWNAFYKDNSVLHAETPILQRQRAALARLFLLTHRQVLGLLGIPEPERM